MPVVEIAAGRVEGRRSGDAVAFQGIPYATAPRFAPPGPIPAWSGVREAFGPGPAAPQPARPAALFTHGELAMTDEECLGLNVFSPSLDGRRPVLVWLHGGGFAIGHAGAGLYSGERLAAAADVVVVTLNYRLGSLGWLGHPDLASGPGAPAANWGLLDQIAALEWVRENVAAFGGDPSRVTLAGQSAGALSAMDLLLAPKAAGLFRRAVLQSPPLGDVAIEPALAIRWAEALSAAAGGYGEFDGRRLRALGAERIVALHEDLLEQPGFRGTRGGALPTIDAGSLPASPVEAPGTGPDVDVLIGHTAQEGTFFFRAPWRPAPPAERIPAVVGHLCHTDEPDAVIDRYRERATAAGTPDDPLSLLVDIATDAMVVEPLARWVEARAGALSGRSVVYRYRVDHPGAGKELGATHTVEVPLLFGTWHDGGAGERLAGQAPGAAEVSVELVTAWGRFARGEAPGWSPVAAGESTPDIRVFGSPSRSRVVSADAHAS
ncbi:MAG TPA: carboxylesterase family protein [Solirubrobacteraceae bacterium]|nr:carboxylesterase family protein [Solirubrobacteraceae bacterium]